MNEKEIGEIRRRQRQDRSNMTAIYGCYVNAQKEIISQFRQSVGMMPENEREKYFSLFKRSLTGTVGRNLIEITFRTAQVADSPEHKLLMGLRDSVLKEESLCQQIFEKIIASANIQENYLILLGCESYDVPFKGKDGESFSEGSDESYQYILCAVCPVKQTKPSLRYMAQEKVFHDGGMDYVVSAPEMGFLFPAFDNRAANIYNALFYTHSAKDNHQTLVESLFGVQPPMAAADQKKSFDSLLSRSLEEECSLEVMQTVHEQLSQRIDLHKQSKVPETLTVGKDEVKQALESCGLGEKPIAKFSVAYDEEFGCDAQLHPKNLISTTRFEVTTPDVSIKVNPERSDLIETRTIGGVRYILICADENVEVNGVSIHFPEEKA